MSTRIGCVSLNLSLVIVLLAIVMRTPPAAAQSPTGFVPPAELVTKYLQQDIFLRPGNGFNRVRLGQKFAEVGRIWGQPNSVQRLSLFRKAWIYRAGQNTSVILSGSRAITGIEVVGDINSPFRSTEGVSFGMTRQQVVTIYGSADGDDNGGALVYPQHGIKLTFQHGTLRTMYVFKPAG